MNLVLSTIVNSKDAFGRLLQQKLPIKKAYQIEKVFRLVEPEISTYESMRTKLIMETYGAEEMKSDGVTGSGDWKVKPELMNDFVKELNELLSVEVKLDFQKVSLPDNTEMTPADIFVLDWVLDMEEESK